jgi:predicted unusual protein kinase regulating ubiquinone biosynthesis (AarF/ABC1/UbiB family)
MQNLKNQPSASDSAINEATNGRANGTPTLTDDAVTVDPVEEPDFLDRVEAPPTDEPAKQKPSVGEVPVPEDSTVEEPAIRPRSLRMQWRFWRTLFFAGWLFARVLFWQVYAKRYVPRYVDESETRRFQKYAREFRDFAVKLGGLYIKLGQFISTRVDVLPEEIIKELESLQDEVPTIQFKHISHVIEREIGPISEHFEWISEAPIAAASLGQVHRAKLHNGDRVVVKVQRPGIRTICFTDLAAMRVVAKIAMRFKFISRRADANALVEEFGTVLLEELSYNHEAFNAHRFAQIFKHNMGVYIPSVYNNLSTDEILVIEDVTSIKINDYAAMDRAGVNRKAVANRLMDTYLSQVFDEYFFHADPHPGNLFVYPLPVEDENADFGEEGRPFYLIFVDFGMTGTLTREIADGMVSTLASILTRDTKKLIESYIELGFILPNADVPRIVEAADAAFDTVWGMSMTEMRDMDFDRVAHLADEFNDLIFSMPFYIPQDFIYLGRTLSILSGMCTSLDPKYNPWKELQPYTELLIARGFGIDANAQQRLPGNLLTTSIVQSLFNGNGRAVLQKVAQEASRRALGPVARADDALQKLSSGDIQVVTKMDLAYRHQMKRIERETQRNGRSIFFGSVLITSTLFYINGDMTLAIIGYVICALVMVLGLLRD